MADLKQYQPKVKNAENVLVGVAQIRIGKPSVRATGTAVTGVVQAVTQSSVITDGTDGVTKVVQPTATANVGTIGTLVSSGTYSGALDGCFILRYDGAAYDIYGPDGYEDADVAAASVTAGYELKLEGAAASGVTVTGTAGGTLTAGDTFIVPVWSGLAQDKTQTGIVTPYSMFKGSAESVGGLRSASFTPAIEDVATLESGFPAEVVDKIVTKTSVAVKFEALEYTNENIKHLKDLVSKIINEAVSAAVPAEVVMRTRGNKLITFWVPNCTIDSAPEFAPTNDFSSLNWEISGSKLAEVDGAAATYNAWLRNAFIYRELEYVH